MSRSLVCGDHYEKLEKHPKSSAERLRASLLTIAKPVPHGVSAKDALMRQAAIPVARLLRMYATIAKFNYLGCQ